MNPYYVAAALMLPVGVTIGYLTARHLHRPPATQPKTVRIESEPGHHTPRTHGIEYTTYTTCPTCGGRWGSGWHRAHR